MSKTYDIPSTRERINEIAEELQKIADLPPSEISFNAANLIAEAAECLGKAAYWPMDRAEKS